MKSIERRVGVSRVFGVMLHVDHYDVVHNTTCKNKIENNQIMATIS